VEWCLGTGTNLPSFNTHANMKMYAKKLWTAKDFRGSSQSLQWIS